MKKKPDSPDNFKSYEGIRLYRDDVELILSILKENNYEIKIADKKFEYETLDELIETRGVKPYYFEIEGVKKKEEYNSIRISFEKKRSYLFSNGKESTKYLFNQIRDICESKYSKFYKVLNPWIYFFLAILLVNVYLPLLTEPKEEATNIPQWLPLIIVMCVAAGGISGLYRYVTLPVVLKRKHENGFWQHNADKIILLIIGALLGAFFKYFLELILKGS